MQAVEQSNVRYPFVRNQVLKALNTNQAMTRLSQREEQLKVLAL